MEGAGAWLLGSGPDCSGKQRNRGPAAILPPHLHPLFVLALAHTAPKGPNCGKSQLGLQTRGLVARLGAQKPGQKSETPPTQLQLCEQHSGITVALGGCGGRPQFPHTGSSGTTWAGCLPCTGIDVTSLVPGSTVAPRARLSSAGQWGPSSQPWDGKRMWDCVHLPRQPSAHAVNNTRH